MVNSDQTTLVDDEDFEWASQYEWRYEGGHVVRYDDQGRRILLAVEVMKRAGHLPNGFLPARLMDGKPTIKVAIEPTNTEKEKS